MNAECRPASERASATFACALALMLWILIALSGCGSGSGSGGGGATASHLMLTGPANIPSATAFQFSVTAVDVSNNPVNTYSGKVHFTSSDVHALLPANIALIGGRGTFNAVLSTAGNQTITATDAGTSSITGNSGTIIVGALANAFLVGNYGAKGDGQSDDTVSIRNAINAAAAAGGGSVVFNVARYYTTGNFVVPQGVVLCGAIEGPFDVAGVDPATTAIAPTLLVTSTSGPFITLNGLGAGVTDLLFHYPNQVKSSASTPTPYPYTILMNGAVSGKVARSTVTNAYNFLDIELGRTMVQDVFIGAFNIGVNIDHTQDFVTLHGLHHGVFWDELESAAYPAAIDSWVLSHGTALVVGRMDALEIHDFSVFSRYAGMLFTDSPDTTLDGRTAWGQGSDIDLQSVQFGIIATASTQQGYKFSNLQVNAAPGLGQAAVQLKSGGTYAADVLINGVSARGTWALGAFPTPQAGHLTLANIQ